MFYENQFLSDAWYILVKAMKAKLVLGVKEEKKKKMKNYNI